MFRPEGQKPEAIVVDFPNPLPVKNIGPYVIFMATSSIKIAHPEDFIISINYL